MTKLQAVNELMTALKRRPVTSYASGVPAEAADCIERWSAEIQAEPDWQFNREENVTYSPAALTGYITLGADILSADPVAGGGYPDCTVRGGRLFNRTDKTYVFTADVVVDLVRTLPFEDLSNAFQRLVAVSATTEFCANMGMPPPDGIAKREQRARMTAAQEDADRADPDMKTAPYFRNIASRTDTGTAGTGSGTATSAATGTTEIDDIIVTSKPLIAGTRTFGVMRNAVAGHFTANTPADYPNQPDIGVMGGFTPGDTYYPNSYAFYAGREGVTLGVIAFSRAKLGASDATTTYTATTVTATDWTCEMDDVEVGMIVDTLHSPKWGGMVSAVDAATRTITVHAWYRYTGVDETPPPGTPADGTGCEVDRMTGLGGQITYLYMDTAHDVTAGTGHELDIINDKAGATVYGHRVVSIGSVACTAAFITATTGTGSFTYGFAATGEITTAALYVSGDGTTSPVYAVLDQSQSWAVICALGHTGRAYFALYKSDADAIRFSVTGAGAVYALSYIDTGDEYRVGGVKVVDAQGAVVADAGTATYGAPAVTYSTPATTYAAPSGGTPLDAQCRASLAQLATDVAAMKTAVGQLATDAGAAKTALAAAAVDTAAVKTSSNAINARLKAHGLIATS